MNPWLATSVIALTAMIGNLAADDGAAGAAERAPVPRQDAYRADNSIHELDLTPAQVEKARAERAAARSARAQLTPDDKRSASVGKQRTVTSSTKSAPENDIHALDASAAERSALRSEKESARVARSERTPAQNKAAANQKRQQLYEVAKSAPGG